MEGKAVMRKVFIDIGGHIGQAIDRFFEEIEDASEWKIFSFEPIQWQNLMTRTKRYGNVEVIRAIVGNVDIPVASIFPVPDGGQGATYLLGKLTGGVQYNKPVIVPCIDLVKWFKEEIKEDDFVVMKMNIEGGEYPLMKRLPEILHRIDGLYIKLHHFKFNSVHKQDLLRSYENFQREFPKCRGQIYCDPSEKPYKFKWMLNNING